MSLFFMKGEREKEKAPQNFFAVSGPQFIGRLHLLSPEFQNRIQNSILDDRFSILRNTQLLVLECNTYTKSLIFLEILKLIAGR